MRLSQNQEVLDALREVYEESGDGLLRPAAVVDRARNPESPLHPHFLWDDAAAAHEHRLDQARKLIREVTVEFDQSWLRGPVPAFVSISRDRGNPGGGYRSTPEVLTNSQLRAELAATARKELEGWARRNRMVKDMCVQVLLAAGIPPTGIFSEADVALVVRGPDQEEAA